MAAEKVQQSLQDSADTEGGWVSVQYNDRLPNTAFMIEGEVEIGPFLNEASLRIKKGGRGT